MAVLLAVLGLAGCSKVDADTIDAWGTASEGRQKPTDAVRDEALAFEIRTQAARVLMRAKGINAAQTALAGVPLDTRNALVAALISSLVESGTNHPTGGDGPMGKLNRTALDRLYALRKSPRWWIQKPVLRTWCFVG